MSRTKSKWIVEERIVEHSTCFKNKDRKIGLCDQNSSNGNLMLSVFCEFVQKCKIYIKKYCNIFNEFSNNKQISII